MEHTSKDRKQLRGLAHSLKPIVQIGKNGLTETVISSVKMALDTHELIKVKFVDNKELRKELAEKLAVECDALLAGIIGNIAVFYRQNPDIEKRKIAYVGDSE